MRARRVIAVISLSLLTIGGLGGCGASPTDGLLDPDPNITDPNTSDDGSDTVGDDDTGTSDDKDDDGTWSGLIPGGATQDTLVTISTSIWPKAGVAPLTVHAEPVKLNSSYMYEWDFGEGEPITAASAEYVYQAPGVQLVKVTATDGTNTYSSTDQTVYVLPPAEIVTDVDTDTLVDGESALFGYVLLEGDLNVGEALASMTYQLIWSVQDPDGLVAQYYGETCEHLFATPGEYTVSLIAQSLPMVPAVTLAQRTLTIGDRPLGQLAVSPLWGLTSRGPEGGAFDPTSRTYTLTNTGTAALTWAAVENAAWLSVTPTSGTLNPGQSTSVKVQITSAATALVPGSYGHAVQFTSNVSLAIIQRTVALTVEQAGLLTMTAASRTTGVAPLGVFFDCVNDADTGWVSNVVQPRGFVDQPTNIPGVKVTRVEYGTTLGDGTLAWDGAAGTLKWHAAGEAYGTAVNVAQGHEFGLPGASGRKLWVWVDWTKLFTEGAPVYSGQVGLIEFAGADNTPVQSATTMVAQTGTAVLSSGGFKATSACIYTAPAALTARNHWITAKTLSGNNNHLMVLGFSDTNNYYEIQLRNLDTTHFRVAQVVGGVSTELGSIAYTRHDGDLITGRWDGTEISVYVNDAKIGAVTPLNALNGTRVGFKTWNATSTACWDDLRYGNGTYVVTRPRTPNVASVTDTIEIENGGVNADWASFHYEWHFGDPAPQGTPTDDSRWYWENGAHQSDGTWFAKNEAFGWNAAHVYEAPGVYVATLKITDDLGGEHEYTQAIEVEDPEVVFNAPVGHTYYFAADGNDLNAGTELAPKRSFEAAKLLAGDNVRLLFKRGDAFPVTLAWNPNVDGAFYVGAWGDENDPRPRFTCGNDVGFLTGNNLEDARFVDLWVDGTYPDSTPGTAFGGLGNNGLALRCKVQDMHDGWHCSWRTHLIVQECEAQNVQKYSYWIGSNPGTAILGGTVAEINEEAFLRVYTDKLVVAHCYWPAAATKSAIRFMANDNAGSWYLCALNKFEQHGISAGADSATNRVQHFMCAGNDMVGPLPNSGTMFVLGGIRGFTGVNNRVFYPTSSAAFEYGKGYLEQDWDNCNWRFLNNTFVIGTDVSNWVRVSAFDAEHEECCYNLTVADNILYSLAGQADNGTIYRTPCASSPLLASNFNYWYTPALPQPYRDGTAKLTLSQWQSFGQDVDSLADDPLLVAPLDGDLRLQAGSACHGAGSAAYAPYVRVDADGNARNAAPSIGAFE